MNKKAIIDIGSLKVKIAIFDIDEKTLLSTNSVLTLLGKGIDNDLVISSESLKLLNDCLKETATNLKNEKISDISIIGTEALRKAINKKEVERLVSKYFPRHKLQIVDQDKEAELFFNAVSREFPDKEIVAIDIGGGSVQIIHGIYNSSSRSSAINKKHNLKTGTYKLQQKYSPDNAIISKDFNRARQIVNKEYEALNIKSPILVFGSTCMLDFILATKIKNTEENIYNLHPIYVEKEDLLKLLEEMRQLPPDGRMHLYPAGGYFTYGADYLMLNLIEAVDRLNAKRIYPTNLNSSYGLI